MSFSSDWNSFFSGSVTPGTVVDLGNGAKVTKMGDGSAVYQDGSGAWVPYTQNDNPYNIARQATGLMDQWNKAYQTPTVDINGNQKTQLDPAAYGFSYNQSGQVTRAGTDPNAQSQTSGGNYTFSGSVDSVSDPKAKEFYKANPQEFYAVQLMGLDPVNYYKSQNQSTYGTGWNASNSSSGYGGGYSGSSGASGGYNLGLNPYLTQAQQAIASQVTDNLKRNILPGISSSAVASGNYGGSRQGVLEANALKDANQQIVNGMANLSYNAYNTATNADLQQQQINNSYNLGLGNLGLGYMNADNNFYTSQRGQDLQQLSLANQMFNTGAQGTLAGGQGLYNVGNTVQQAPWQTIGNFSGTSRPYAGFDSETGSTSSNPWASAIGGAFGGAQLFNLFK